MNTYPDFAQIRTGDRQRLSDHEVSIAASNQLYTRVWQGDDQRWNFRVVHLVNSSQRATLRAFYNANRFVPFYFRLTDPNDTQRHEVMFTGPIDERKESPGYWTMEAQLQTWEAIAQPFAFLLVRPSGGYLLQSGSGDRIGVR